MTFKLNPSGVDSYLRSAPVLAYTTAVAVAVQHAAADVAPQGATGDLKGSYKTQQARPTLLGPEATVYTDDFAGHLAEWGSVNNPPYAPLRLGAQRVGLVVRELPKS